MRVAITDFWATANFEEPRHWTPTSPVMGEKSLHVTGFTTETREFQTESGVHTPSPKWGEILLRRSGLWGYEVLKTERLAVVFGSSKGDVHRFGDWNGDWPFPYGYAWAVGGCVLAGGPVLSPVAACATGAHSLALGAMLIEDGKADVVIAGAQEPAQLDIFLAAYRNMGALSKSGTMRPFDQARDGFIPASGAGFLILESEEFALNRGAEIQGYLTGYSMKCDATHMTSMSPSGDSIARAVEDALRRAGNPKIDYINAHGTSTKLNDAVESRGIESALGRNIPVSSTKPLTGHLLGAAGAVESAICLLAMKDGFAPPNLNLENVDEGLNLDFVTGEGRALEINACLSLNYGFGGHIGSLIFEKN